MHEGFRVPCLTQTCIPSRYDHVAFVKLVVITGKSAHFLALQALELPFHSEMPRPHSVRAQMTHSLIITRSFRKLLKGKLLFISGTIKLPFHVLPWKVFM